MRWMKPNASGSRLRRAPPHWPAPAAKAAACVAVFAVAFAGPTWLWRSGWLPEALHGAETTAITVAADIGLTVENILVQGRVNTSRPQIDAALGLVRGDPIMSFNPQIIRQRLESLTWVRWATVERRLPQTVIVRIDERRPMALWQRDGKLALVDDEGVVITRRQLERFRDLVVIVGGDAPDEAPALFTLLAAQPRLSKRVRAAVRVGARRWNLRLDNGIDIQLPEENASDAWARLAELDREHRLLARDIELIDLRLPGRMIVRARRVRPPSGKSDGKST